MHENGWFRACGYYNLTWFDIREIDGDVIISIGTIVFVIKAKSVQPLMNGHFNPVAVCFKVERLSSFLCSIVNETEVRITSKG